MISDEAVEAAAKAIAGASGDWADGEWDNTAISDRFRDGTRAEARAALEAAAPHMLADAWSEGYKARSSAFAGGVLEFNPYRSQA